MSRPPIERGISSGIEDVEDSLKTEQAQLIPEKSAIPDEMAALSKEDDPNAQPQATKSVQSKSDDDDDFHNFIVDCEKSITRWCHFSFTNEIKREIAKSSAVANEKDVILARITDLPAWVYFPDVERCEWISRILHQVWPNANYYAKDLVKEVIESKVAEALSESKLNGFKFDRIMLGTIPPRIGGVKVYDKNTSLNEIILDMDLFYASDCDINFQLAGMKAGIKDFQIHGMIRFIMKPLISRIPLVGGLQIFFLNNPDIDFNLVGVADLLDMPGLSDMLRLIIIEQIGAIMVLPNKLPISLSNEVPSIALQMPEPEGVLRIHVVEAKDLMKKDIGVLGKGKSDPYAIITVGAQQFRTQTIDNTVNPKWDYWCEAVMQTEVGQYVQFNLFDKDEASDYENLGRATVEINNVVKTGTLDTWITLEQAKHGMLHVRFTWLDLSSAPSDLAAALAETQHLRVTNLGSAILSVYIDSANDLPQARVQSKPDPFSILSVGEANKKTAALRRTDAPVWEQGYMFLVGNPENDTLQVRVIDQKTEKDLGQLTYVLSTLLTKNDLQVVSQPFQFQKTGPNSKVTMSMALKILKRGENESGEAVLVGEIPMIQRQASQASQTSQALPLEIAEQKSVKLAEFPSKLAEMPGESFEAAEPIVEKAVTVDFLSNETANSQNDAPSQTLLQRQLSTQSSTGYHGRGRIQISLHYSMQRQCLSVTVQKIVGGSPVIGMIKISLDDPDITTQGISSFCQLLPEIKLD